MANDNTLSIVINGTAKDFLDEMEKVKKSTESAEKVLTKVAKTSAVAFVGFAGSIALATRAFAKYETALVGVGKTTDISGKKLKSFGLEFQKMAQEIPLSTNELLGIAQAAGQLGVSGEENLLKFTDTIAKLGVATDLTGEQGATALTRILNITTEAIDTIDVFGSVIVALGNSFAASESEIVKVTSEVARSTGIFKVSAANAAAIAAAMRSLGVQAQLGGSAVGRAFQKIDKAIRGGGQVFKNLEEITGITGDKLKQTFETDSVKVFQAFIEGLGRVQKSGGSTADALAVFGLKGDEILKVLPVLAKNSGDLARAINVAGKETKNATALNIEAKKAYATLESEVKKTVNSFENFKVKIGEQLAPAVTSLVTSVRGLLNAVNNLDKNTINIIATFLKWGTIITASVTIAASAVLGFLKLKAVIAGLRTVFVAGRIAAIGFTGALTGGLSIIIGFLPEIISGFKTLLGLLEKDSSKGLDKINEKLDALKQKREDLSKPRGFTPAAGSAQLAGIDKEIAKLEELKKKKEEVQQADTAFVGPLQPKEVKQKQDDKAAQLQADEANKLKIVQEATQKRIELAKQENDNLKALQAARLSGANEQELEFLARKQEILAEKAEAAKIKDEEERAIAAENLDLKHEQELAKIAEFEAMKDEQQAEFTAERLALQEELQDVQKELDAEEMGRTIQFNKQETKELQKKILTKKEAEKLDATERLNRQIAERNQFTKDEMKFGTGIAKFKQFLNSSEIQATKDTSAQLAQLARSKNSTLKGIGKAAARVNAAIATAEGAIKAYTSLAGIPLIGPGLGVIAATALTAYGVERQGEISRMATGGFVPPTSGGSRDRALTLLEPNELVVPAGIAPNFIQAAGLPDTQGREAVEETGNKQMYEISIEDRAAEFITLQQREGRSLGII